MSEEQIANIIKWVRETNYNLSSLPYKVCGIGWGPKVSNGSETGEYAVTFTVTEKLPLSAIPQEELIPKFLNVEGVNVRTDVHEPVLLSRLVVDCHVGQPTLYNPAEPVLSHRNKYRPLKGGISSISFNGTDATLGLLVRDRVDGQIVALSNSHVYAGSQVGAYVPTRQVNEDNFTNVSRISARQPASISYTPFGGSQQADYIGNCKRAVMIGDIQPIPIAYSGSTPIVISSCDAAIVHVNQALLDSTSNSVLNFNQQGPYQFATNAEIDSLLNTASVNYGAPVFRAGRTCGPIGFPGYTNSCNLSVYNFDIAYVGLYSNHLSYFYNSFSVRGDVVPGRGGDSGSAMFALFNRNSTSLSAWKVIGLLFAGPSGDFPSYTTGSRITTVAENLNIIPWNSQIPTLTSRNVVVDQSINRGIISLSGRAYYEIGW